MKQEGGEQALSTPCGGGEVLGFGVRFGCVEDYTITPDRGPKVVS